MKGGTQRMSKIFKASPATQGASAAGSSASEKKEKKKKLNSHKVFGILGCAVSIAFILVAVFQTTGALSNISAASIVYDVQLNQMKEAEEKAKEVIEKDLDITINDDGTIIDNDNTSDSNPVSVGDNDTNKNYYIDDDGNIVYIDDAGDATVYYICTTCSECGEITKSGTKCEYCGSNLYKYSVYQVECGDTLSEISGIVGASVDSIAHLNEIDNVNLIYAGESLRVPE
jgi:nucleoid-associated protein YgaU